MEQIISVADDDSITVYSASDVVLTYTDGSERWSGYVLSDAVAMFFEYLYRADDLNGAVIGVNSLRAATGPTGALQLIEEPAP